MIEVYTIMHDGDKVDKKKLFSISQNTKTRGDPVKLNNKKNQDRQKDF